jgi:plastocyanin
MNGGAPGIVRLILALALVGAACSSNSSTAAGSPSVGATTSSSASGSPCEESTKTITLNGQTANDHGTKDVSGGGKEEVEVDSCYFNPTVFTGHAGDKLVLTLSNESDILHNFSLPEQSINKNIPSDGKVTVTVTFPTSGTLVFFCSIHQSLGMVGGLEVET